MGELEEGATATTTAAASNNSSPVSETLQALSAWLSHPLTTTTATITTNSPILPTFQQEGNPACAESSRAYISLLLAAIMSSNTNHTQIPSSSVAAVANSSNNNSSNSSATDNNNNNNNNNSNKEGQVDLTASFAAALLAQQQQQPPQLPDAASTAALALALQQQQQLQQQQLQQQLAAAVAAQPHTFLHNLIPSHLQSAALAPSLHGTPGYPSALIPPHQQQQLQQQQLQQQQILQQQILQQQQQLQSQATISASLNSLLHQAPAFAAPTNIPLTVQDRPMTPPVYNGVNPQYPGLRVLSNTPPMFCVDNFLNPFECDFLIQVAQDSFGPAPVVGKGAGEVSPSRTSSTCYLAREDVPDMMRKISLLTGKPMEHCELPQVGRYFPSQQYLQHFDAFDLSTEDGRRFAANGGQRTITVLIYLNDVPRGGATRFPALNMQVQPRRGMALVFFPAMVDGMLDKMALHAAMPAIDTKYVSQCWIRQTTYNGQPSKRLPATLGPPLGAGENNPSILQQQFQMQQQQQQQ